MQLPVVAIGDRNVGADFSNFARKMSPMIAAVCFLSAARMCLIH
jgi:hypothetical protein